jgi:hypothetical protein
MADGHVSDQGIKIRFPKNLSHQTHVGMDYNMFAVGGGNSSALLPAVLQGKKAEKCQPASIPFRGV